MYSLCRKMQEVPLSAVKSWAHTLLVQLSTLSVMLSRYSTLTFDRWIFAWHMTQKNMTLSTLCLDAPIFFSCMNFTCYEIKLFFLLDLTSPKHTPKCLVYDLPVRSVWHTLWHIQHLMWRYLWATYSSSICGNTRERELKKIKLVKKKKKVSTTQHEWTSFF